ncbi:hypothetical protein [Paenibacillus illinoisensis]|uniref:hypothetical protein n=1 Tax=Paenibacillus illinoisensis TaxID=59845 RepID=UPI001C8DD2F6|nr:hypothetical protein [Paenibacillus illinoisensis]MBY0217958.1 hypothetical protein [Paenibacillus illinoisensis]
MTDIVFEFSQPKDKKTGSKDIALTDGFIDALFSISEKIHTSEKFRTRSNGVSRLVWHVTEADIMLMVTLHVCFNSEGKLENVSRHQIYKKLYELYEDPCCDDQFYIAFEKFVRLGLIQEKLTGVTSEFSLTNFINPDTNKIGRIVVVNPFVFSKGFTDLPISAQKFVFDLLRKQGNEKEKEVFYWLNKEKGILKQLHKKHVYELKNILQLLSMTAIRHQEPLIKSWNIEGRRGSTSPKLTVIVNESYTSKYISGTQYRDVLQGKKTNRRVIRHLKNLLSEHLIGEFEYLNDGRDFYQLVRLLRGKSYKYMAYVIEKIRELYEKNRMFPTDIMEFIRDEMRHKGMVTYLEIAKQTGVYKFICPRKLDENRLYEFAAAASMFSQREFAKLCLASVRPLETSYTRPPAFSHHDYAQSKDLEYYLDAVTMRTHAFTLRKCPTNYKELEIQARIRLENEHEPRAVREWMINKIEILPSWTTIPDVPLDFKLEDHILTKEHTA